MEFKTDQEEFWAGKFGTESLVSQRLIEYIDLETGNKSGDGSAGYFLPLFWILGRF